MPEPTHAALAHDVSFVGTLMVVLGCTALVTLLLQRLRLALIPIYLLTGTLIGPHALGLVRSAEELQEVSHLAMILLLFGVGLELELAALRHGLARMVAAGMGAVLFCAALAWPLIMQVGLSPPAALAIALALSLSSTALVLRILAQRRELESVGGRMALGILVMQDILVLGMLAAIPLLVRWADVRGELVGLDRLPELLVGNWRSILTIVVTRGGGVVGLALVARLLLPRLLSESLRSRSLEVLLLVGVAVALATAYATKRLGFSLEIGAFLAGFFLSGTAFRHQLSGQIAPLRDLLLAVFFTTLGMELDPRVFWDYGPFLLAALTGTLLLKTLGIALANWLAGVTASTALGVGLILAQTGEFSLVLLDAAQRQGLLGPVEVSLCIAVILVSLCVTPGLHVLGSRLMRSARGQWAAPWVRRGLGGPAGEEEGAGEAPQVVIAGFGPVGRRVAELLEDAGIGHVVIELNPQTVREPASKLRRYVFGDAARAEVLSAAGLQDANVLALTIPDEQATLRACGAARRVRRDIYIVARVRAALGREAARAAGADRIVADELAAADVAVEAIRGHCVLPPAASAGDAPPVLNERA